MSSPTALRRWRRREVDRALSRAFSRLAGDPLRMAAFDRLHLVMRRRSALLDSREGPAAVRALAALSCHHDRFVRPPESWTGAHGCLLGQIAPLAEHLFSDYPLPRFLASAWTGVHTRHVVWRRCYVEHAGGTAFRRCGGPIPMTRRTEHLLLRSPDHLAIVPAIRRAEVLAFGGSDWLADTILPTPLAQRMTDNDFWRAAIQFLVNNEGELSAQEVARVVAYLAFTVDFEHTRGAAPATGFGDPGWLKGRTARSVLRLADAWAGLGATNGITVSWPASGWRELTVTEVRPDQEAVLWTVTELLSSTQLRAEGLAMRHCVGEYVDMCRYGRSSIWSVRRYSTASGTRSKLTIEVDRRSRAVVQAKARCNTRPGPMAVRLMRRWALREGLTWDQTSSSRR